MAHVTQSKPVQYFMTKRKIWNDLIVAELSGDLDCVWPEVRDACRGADSSSRMDNEVLRFFNQLSESFHLYFQLLGWIKTLQ